MVRRPAALAAALLLALPCTLVSPGCKGTTPSLQSAVDSFGDSIRTMLGAPTLPGKYVLEIYTVHVDDRTWSFREGEDKPLERTREAVRGLATADYGSWRESSIVTSLLTAMADEHPSSLVRAEALDTLTRMFPWTSAAVSPTERRATQDEVVAAIQRITKVRSQPVEDPGVAADLADALNVIAAFRFDQARVLPAELDRRRFARESHTQLSTARGVLRALTGGALDRYDADPRVREAMDRALVSTSAAAIRLSLLSAACGARDDIVRTAAVRDIELARPDQAARILGLILATDDASSVRREAARALGTFPEAESVPELLPALADDRFEVRGTAAASLSAVTGQSFGDDRVAWVRWWQARAAAAQPAPAAPTAPTGTEPGAPSPQ